MCSEFRVMKFDPDRLREEVSAAVERSSYEQASKQFGVSIGGLRGFIRGGDMLSRRAAAIAAQLGMPLYYGPPHQIGPVREVVIDDEEYVGVPQYDAEPSSGNDTEPEGDILERIAFRRDFLRRYVPDPGTACLLKVAGDSMAPRLNDGDVAVIDRDFGEVMSGKVYAFIDADGDLRVKRFQRLDQQLVLLSDNPAFPAEVRTEQQVEEMVIIGRVLWSLHIWHDQL